MNPILLPIAMLAAGAVWATLSGAWPRASLAGALTAVAGSGLACVRIGLLPLTGNSTDGSGISLSWPLPLGSAHLQCDGLSGWFMIVIGVVSLSVALYSWGYMRREIARGSVSVFGALLCLLTATLVVVVCAADVVLFLVGWEAMTLCAFFLIGFHDRDPEARRGAWMYIVATHLGTALCLLPMFALLVRCAGTTDFTTFRSALASAAERDHVLLFLLGLIGFGAKAGFMPMHVWLPAAHPVAPTPASALLSGVVIKTGIYGLLRLLTWFPPLPASCGVLVLILGVVGGVFGVLYALAQHDLKRLLAYHSVENIGIIVVGIGIGMLAQQSGHLSVATLGYAGALLHVLNHALFKALLFLSAGAVIFSTGCGRIDRLGGLARRAPVNACLFLVGAVAICGLPPLNGFVSEWLIYGSLFNSAFSATGAAAAGPVVAVVSLALMGGLALACFAKVFAVVFLGDPRDPALWVRPIPGSMTAGMVLLAVPCVVIGLLPGSFVKLVIPGIRQIVPPIVDGSAGVAEGMLTAAGTLSWLAAAFALFLVVLTLGRRRLTRTAAPSPRSRTWGCGYAYPTPRMQYTASSFAWSLIASFRSLLWPDRHHQPPRGAFPQGSQLATHTFDLAEHDIFAPLLRGAARLCAMIKTLTWTGQAADAKQNGTADPQAGKRPIALIVHHVLNALRRGSIHIYLGFIVLTLITLFVIEAAFSPGVHSAVDPRPIHRAGSEGEDR